MWPQPPFWCQPAISGCSSTHFKKQKQYSVTVFSLQSLGINWSWFAERERVLRLQIANFFFLLLVCTLAALAKYIPLNAVNNNWAITLHYKAVPWTVTLLLIHPAYAVSVYSGYINGVMTHKNTELQLCKFRFDSLKPLLLKIKN